MLKRALLLSAILFSGCTLLQPPPAPIKTEPVNTPDAPAVIGPYSQAIKIGNMVYCSGQLAINPATGDLIIGDIKDETRQVMKNLGAVLKAANMDHGDIIKATVFLTDMNDYKLFNEAYSEFFAADDSTKPARETVQVGRLPRDGRIEISCIAVKAEE